MIQQKYQSTHVDSLKLITDKINQETAIKSAIKNHQGAASLASGGGTMQRTLASPDWDGNPPLNWRKSVLLSSVSMADFDAGNTHLEPQWYCFIHFFPWGSLEMIAQTISNINMQGRGQVIHSPLSASFTQVGSLRQCGKGSQCASGADKCGGLVVAEPYHQQDRSASW